MRGSFHLDQDGEVIYLASAYTPVSDGLVQRTPGVLLNARRTLLLESEPSLKFWTLAVKHAVNGKNFVLHRVTEISFYENLLKALQQV